MPVQCELNSASSASHHEPDPVTSYHKPYFSFFDPNRVIGYLYLMQKKPVLGTGSETITG